MRRSLGIRLVLFVLASACIAAGLTARAEAGDAQVERERLFVVFDEDTAKALSDERLAFEKVVLAGGDFEFAGTSEMETLYADCGADLGVDAQTRRDCQLRAANRVMVTQILVVSGRKLEKGRYAVSVEAWSPESNGKLWGDVVEADAKSLAVAGRAALPELAGRYLCWRGVASACGDQTATGSEPPEALTSTASMTFLEGRTVTVGHSPEQLASLAEVCARDLGEASSCKAHYLERQSEPRKDVAVGSVYIDNHEVTVEAWDACVAAGGCKARDLSACYEGANTSADGKATHPVNCVSWYDARDYCAWVDKRLPTNAEWTRAARSAGDLVFPWGDDHPSAFDQPVANLADGSFGKANDSGRPSVPGYDDGFAQTAPVGTMALDVSPDGIHDLGGNVQEWVSDVSVDGAGGERRTRRGSSWLLTTFVASVGWNGSTAPSDSVDGAVGFRCAKDP